MVLALIKFCATPFLVPCLYHGSNASNRLDTWTRYQLHFVGQSCREVTRVNPSENVLHIDVTMERGRLFLIT